MGVQVPPSAPPGIQAAIKAIAAFFVGAIAGRTIPSYAERQWLSGALGFTRLFFDSVD
jgi:hypothetical protein